MPMEINQYKIESQSTGGNVVHTYWAGEVGDIKTILRGQKLNQSQYNKFKQTVNGILTITGEIDAIAKDHEERLKRNKGAINSLETTLVLGNLCVEETQNA